MHVEAQIIASISRTQSMEAVLKHNLQPYHFLQRRLGDQSPEPLPGEVFSWQLEHMRRFRTVPSLDLLRARWPLFEVEEGTDSVGALLEQMIRLVNRRALIEHVRHLSEIADDPARLLDVSTHAFEAARDLSRAIPTTGVTRLSDALDMLDLYKQKEALGATPGISLGMEWLDDYTYGIQPHEMMIIEGFLSSKKSSWSALICANAYFLRGQTPLFFSFEMEADKLVQRWIAMAAKFEYRALKRLQLGGDDLERWEKVGERARDAKFEKDVLVIDDERRPTDDFIHAKMVQWSPDFAVVDTIDEVRAPATIKSHWEKGDHVARELKGIARTTKIPIIALAQSGRDADKEGATIANMAQSITIPRKADIVVGLHCTDNMDKIHQWEVRLLKNRDDSGKGTVRTMYFHPGTMSLRPWLPSDNIPEKT